MSGGHDMLDDLASDLAPLLVPNEWRARELINGDEGEVVTGLIQPVATDEALLRQFGYDPDEIELVGNIGQWRKEMADGTWRVSYRFSHRRRSATMDLPALYQASKRAPKVGKPGTAEKTTVVVFADPQIGKSDHRGGTPELLARLAEKRVALEAHIRKSNSSAFVFADVGDGPESFENTAGQAFTNDLSFPQQLDVYATELYLFLTTIVKHGPVEVLGVPSNHAQWRNGKAQLGRPHDDWGLFVHKQVAKQTVGLPVTYFTPAEWTESLVHDVRGTRLGVTHGHQVNRPDGFPNWWAGQTHGGMAFAHADVAVTGHFHHLRIQPTGRNAQTGKSKWWVQAPTLDNGSSWYRNRSGDDSDPGLLVFDITDEGFDLQSLTVL